MPRTKKAAEATPEPQAESKEPKVKHGRLSGFNSHGKRFRQITLPRAVHETLIETHPEGTLYDVQVEDGGVVVCRPVAAE